MKKFKQVILQSYYLKLYHFLTALTTFLRHFEADVVILRIDLRSASPNFQCSRIKLMTVLLVIAFVVSYT